MNYPLPQAIKIDVTKMQKRKSYDDYKLPPGTFGLEARGDELYTFLDRRKPPPPDMHDVSHIYQMSAVNPEWLKKQMLKRLADYPLSTSPITFVIAGFIAGIATMILWMLWR